MIRAGSSNVREFWIADHCSSIIRGNGTLKENLGEDSCASPHLQSAIHNLNSTIPRGHSSVGRAPALQAGSQGFESPCLQSILAREQRLPICDIRFPQFWQKLKPDGDLAVHHPAIVRFFERAKLRSCASKAALFCSLIVPRQVPPNTQLTRP